MGGTNSHLDGVGIGASLDESVAVALQHHHYLRLDGDVQLGHQLD